MDKRLEMLKEEYANIPIPKELDEIVTKALHTAKAEKVTDVFLAPQRRSGGCSPNSHR